MMMMMMTANWNEQALKAPAIQDDADGHLIYRTGDILHNRCSWKFYVKPLFLQIFFFLCLLVGRTSGPFSWVFDKRWITVHRMSLWQHHTEDKIPRTVIFRKLLNWFKFHFKLKQRHKRIIAHVINWRQFRSIEWKCPVIFHLCWSLTINTFMKLKRCYSFQFKIKSVGGFASNRFLSNWIKDDSNLRDL